MEQKHYTGLTDNQVLESRSLYGENTLTPPPQESVWKKFLQKFQDTIIIILLIALLASIGVAIYEYFAEDAGWDVFLEPIGIFVAVILATLVGFLFEQNAERKFKVLNQVNDDTLFKVIRNGGITEVPKKEIVKGDIILLNGGDEIPADGRLLESVSLQVNESTLTGEPLTRKSADSSEEEKDTTYPVWQVLKGTTVVEGHGIMEVESVGDSTEYGKVYKGSQIENKIQTPLNIQLNRLGKLITRVSYSMAALILISRIILMFTNNLWGQGTAMYEYLLNSVMIAVTIIVVSVPEGLPMSVTLSLALSMKRMLATNNLVRKLHACETMGAATVICTDKTGTLTQNQMRIFQTRFPMLGSDGLKTKNNHTALVEEAIATNSTAFIEHTPDGRLKVLGNPTEGALLLWLQAEGVNYLQLREADEVIAQLPFSTERKYMATLVYSPVFKKNILFLKGAPEVIMKHCRHAQTGDHLVNMDEVANDVNKDLLGYQNQGMRTLGFAYKFVEDISESAVEKLFAFSKLDAYDLIFMGIAAISDPVRADVPEAIRETQDAGIQVKIVTGDTPATAKEIGRQIGLWGERDTDRNQISGPEFAALSDQEAFDRVMDLKIMSRARPMDKERLVRLLQKHHQVVAVTGDGTNDAPALNAAQVGLSMGDGTTVAKEASAITILDNSFTSIGRAVMWGRSLYRNIQRFLFFQLIINVVACLVVFSGALFGTTSPLTVTQMLWVNLIMDTFAALALASLPPSPDVMKNPPRKHSDHILTKNMRRSILMIGAIFIIILLSLQRYFANYDLTSLSDFNFIDWINVFSHSSTGPMAITPYEQSVFFSVFVMLQFWNLFNAKVFGSRYSAFHQMRDSMNGFVPVLFIILIGQILIVTFGGTMFQVTPLLPMDWVWVMLFTSPVLWVGELVRAIERAVFSTKK